MRKISAWIALTVLLIVPFFNWRLGATFWMCAMLVFVLQQFFSGRILNRGVFQEDQDQQEDRTDTHTKEPDKDPS